MEDKDKLDELKDENQRLRERLALLEARMTVQRVARNRLLQLVIRTFAGRPLYGSVNQLVDELSERRLERETIKRVVYATLHRLTRVGMLTLLVALGPLALAGLQTYYLKKQNEKFDIQNSRIQQQTYLQEAERRSSLVFLFDNVLDKIDEELRLNPNRRELSPQLIGRIVALTKALKPYRFLEGDTITSRPTSPERGQVLLSILASKLNQNTYDQVFLLADFSYATLQSVNLDGAYLRNINLSNAVLSAVSLTGADLRYANLDGADISGAHVQVTGKQARPARFDFANFHRAHLTGCDFSGSSFEFANFADAHFRRVAFRQAFFNQTNFTDIQADTLDFEASTLLNTSVSVKKLPGGSAPYFLWTGIQVDTATYHQLARLPLHQLPRLDSTQRNFRINRDTFYVDDKKAVIVEDSLEIFGVKMPGEH